MPYNKVLFYFIFEKEVHSLRNQQKLLSNNTRLVASLWMSSNQIHKKWDCLANLANLSATLFPLHFTCENVITWKLVTRCQESSIRWPKEAIHSSSKLREFIMVSESPSNTTVWRLNSLANRIALLHARASTSSTNGSKAILSKIAQITFPSWSLITTPIPAAPSSWKMAPWKLALHQELGGGNQWTSARGWCETVGMPWTCWNSWNRFMALAWICKLGNEGEPVRIAFLLYQILQEINANLSTYNKVLW